MVTLPVTTLPYGEVESSSPTIRGTGPVDADGRRCRKSRGGGRYHGLPRRQRLGSSQRQRSGSRRTCDRRHSATSPTGSTQSALERTNTIALVLTDMTNPFFTTVARGVEDAASDAGLMLIICSTDERDADEQRYVEMLLQRQVDGILLVPARSGDVAIAQCAGQRTPIVVVDRRLSGRVADVVRGDSRGGRLRAGTAARVARASNDGGLGRAPKAVSTADDRVAGFRAALAEAEGSSPPRVYRGAFTIEGGREMAKLAVCGDASTDGVVRSEQLHRHRRPSSARRDAGPRAGGHRRCRLRRPATGDGDLPVPDRGGAARLRDGTACGHHAARCG